MKMQLILALCWKEQVRAMLVKRPSEAVLLTAWCDAVAPDMCDGLTDTYEAGSRKSSFFKARLVNCYINVWRASGQNGIRTRTRGNKLLLNTHHQYKLKERASPAAFRRLLQTFSSTHFYFCCIFFVFPERSCDEMWKMKPFPYLWLQSTWVTGSFCGRRCLRGDGDVHHGANRCTVKHERTEDRELRGPRGGGARHTTPLDVCSRPHVDEEVRIQ